MYKEQIILKVQNKVFTFGELPMIDKKRPPLISERDV
jgi:hypothetical protein